MNLGLIQQGSASQHLGKGGKYCLAFLECCLALALIPQVSFDTYPRLYFLVFWPSHAFLTVLLNYRFAQKLKLMGYGKFNY